MAEKMQPSIRREFAAAVRDAETAPAIDDTYGQGPTGPKIRCPKCQWIPRADNRWMCHCTHIWNTFDTGGVCPGCLYQWRITMCLRCRQWSAHSDWYTQE